MISLHVVVVVVLLHHILIHISICHPLSFMEAKNGEEAYERVMEAVATFELIITDIQMPICNGFDFTRKVPFHF